MKKKVIRFAAAVMCVALAASGCGKPAEETSGSSITYANEGTYPVECEDTLTVWMELNSIQSSLYSNFGESEFAKELERATGIKVEYLHPAAGLAGEQFNLLMTSDNKPDIIVSNWHGYGGQKAIDEGVIYPLNEIMDKWAPNYKKVIESMPNVSKMLKTDAGNYYSFAFIREDTELGTYGGPIIRADWLKKVGMDVPETIDEWEAVLTAFKEELNVEAPLMLVNADGAFAAGMFTGAFGITDDFYLDDGVVKYGPIQPEYKDFITLMKKWYDKGLLDRNFSGADGKILQNAILNGKTGATYQLVGGGIGTWLDTKKALGDTEYDLVGAPYPVLKKGDTPKFSQMDWQYTPLKSWAISTDCKNVELAARLLDWGYSEQGYLHLNYGTEGETYEVRDGKAQFTDFALNNPDGKSFNEILARYALGSSSGPCLQSLDVVRQTRSYPQQNEAVKTWKQTDVADHKLPMINFTKEENDEISSILTDLYTYQDEMLYGFIMGTESIDDWNGYLATMEEIGASRLVEIYQAAVDRYMER